MSMAAFALAPPREHPPLAAPSVCKRSLGWRLEHKGSALRHHRPHVGLEGKARLGRKILRLAVSTALQSAEAIFLFCPYAFCRDLVIGRRNGIQRKHLLKRWIPRDRKSTRL